MTGSKIPGVAWAAGLLIALPLAADYIEAFFPQWEYAAVVGGLLLIVAKFIEQYAAAEQRVNEAIVAERERRASVSFADRPTLADLEIPRYDPKMEWSRVIWG